MPEALAEASAQAREAATLAELFTAARQRQQTAQERAPQTPRFVAEIAQSMAGHMALSAPQVEALLPKMALWQLYLPSALGGYTWDYATVRERLPWSYARVRASLAAVEARPQVVATTFHMAAFPVIGSLVGAAWDSMHDGPLHLLMASRNLAWLRVGGNAWINRTGEILGTDPAGLRQLMAGLKTGAIRRLLILADGPQAPGGAGVRTLAGVSPRLGVKVSLLAKLHALGIPLAPITHEWEDERLMVTPRALLDPAGMDERETLDAMIGHMEGLLHRHPEQWMNWAAARLRT